MTQLDRVVDRLNKKGYVTRNWALSTYPMISRLGAHVCTLKKEGFNIDGHYTKDKKDYVYTLLDNPK